MENAVESSQNNVTQQNARPENWPVESQERLIQLSKQNLYQKIPKRWKEYFLFAIGMLVTISIFSLTVFLALRKYKSTNTCTTPECIRSANNLLQSMNTSVQPCDNFYKFACDNWRHEHVMEEPKFINNWFEERAKLIKRNVIEFLEQENSDDEPTPVHQVRTVYDACLDFESINENGLETLWELLDRIGLPHFPPLTKEPGQNWVRSMAKIRRHVGMDVLVGFSVMSSLANSTVNQLAVATTDDTDIFLRRKWSDLATETVLERSLQKGSVDVIRHWKDFSVRVMKFLAEKGNYSNDDLQQTIARASLRILQIKQNITLIESNEEVMGPYINDIPDEMELTQLQDLVDNSSTMGESKLVWETYFESMFEDVDGVELNFPDDQILVYKRIYFELLSGTLDYLSEKDLELFLWWEVVYSLAPHVHEDLKTYKDIYKSKVLSSAQQEPRSSECAKYVYTFMDPALSYLSVTTFDFELMDTIADMISNIQEAFIESINDLTWMDVSTKKATVEKIKAIRRFVGIPDWIIDKYELESMYNITVNETTHLANLLEIMDGQVFSTLLALREINNSSESQFSPLDINAYYDPSGNAISVPAAVMQFPFYDLGLESLNYGAIGSILGHEMTHALDSYGRRFDLHGNLNNKWWTNNSVIEYEKRTECYVNTYNNYLIPTINGTVNGNVTLAENLADDGGARNAFLAYRRYTKNFELVEPKLPGMEKYSHKQLFFLAHANMWCSEYTDESLSETLDYDEHSPQFVRVNKQCSKFVYKYESFWRLIKPKEIDWRIDRYLSTSVIKHLLQVPELALMCCSEYTDESLNETLDYGKPSPQFVRVNRVMQNTPEFSKAWNCPLGSKMNPEKKCQLWLD